MKKLAIIFPILALLLLVVSAFFLGKGQNKVQINNLGGTQVIQSTYSNATSSSFTCLATPTTSSPVLALDPSRTETRIFNRSGWPMFLYVRSANTTTTGIVVNSGIYLSPDGLTTSTQIWADLSGAKGYIQCISPFNASGTLFTRN